MRLFKKRKKEEEEKKITNFRDLEWKSQKGHIRIRDMDDFHIFNCINFLNRRMEEYDENTKKAALSWIRLFKLEQTYRLKMANTELDEMINNEFNQEFFDDDELIEDWRWDR